jgi:hypothetical protein
MLNRHRILLPIDKQNHPAHLSRVTVHTTQIIRLNIANYSISVIKTLQLVNWTEISNMGLSNVLRCGTVVPQLPNANSTLF